MLRIVERVEIIEPMDTANLKRKHFFILGNGGGGTSLLRGLCHAHPNIECLFEHWGYSPKDYKAQLDHWRQLAAQAESANRTWGNKIPIEQFITRKWDDYQIVNLIETFHVIWLRRRFSRYLKPSGRHKKTLYLENWQRAAKIYWDMREAYPDRVMLVSFEDLLLRTSIELKRICAFLKIRYKSHMIEGTRDTGYRRYDQAGINMDKI